MLVGKTELKSPLLQLRLRPPHDKRCPRPFQRQQVPLSEQRFPDFSVAPRIPDSSRSRIPAPGSWGAKEKWAPIGAEPGAHAALCRRAVTQTGALCFPVPPRISQNSTKFGAKLWAMNKLSLGEVNWTFPGSEAFVRLFLPAGGGGNPGTTGRGGPIPQLFMALAKKWL